MVWAPYFSYVQYVCMHSRCRLLQDHVFFLRLQVLNSKTSALRAWPFVVITCTFRRLSCYFLFEHTVRYWLSTVVANQSLPKNEHSHEWHAHASIGTSTCQQRARKPAKNFHRSSTIISLFVAAGSVPTEISKREGHYWLVIGVLVRRSLFESYCRLLSLPVAWCFVRSPSYLPY
jgi:hypothetical protein